MLVHGLHDVAHLLHHRHPVFHVQAAEGLAAEPGDQTHLLRTHAHEALEAIVFAEQRHRLRFYNEGSDRLHSLRLFHDEFLLKVQEGVAVTALAQLPGRHFHAAAELLRRQNWMLKDSTVWRKPCRIPFLL